MQYSTYLFDLDGTLYSRDALVRQLVQAQWREFKSELSHIDGDAYIERVIELDAHGYQPKEEVYARIAEEWDLNPGVQSRLIDHFRDTYDSHCSLPEDTLTTLRTLSEQGARMAIVTNGQTDRQNRKIDALGIRDFFDAILISEAEGLKKPHAEIFHRAVSRCSGSAGDAVFVGDHPIADIDGARDAGLAAVWKKVPYWNMARDDVLIVEKLMDIVNMVSERD